MESIICFALFRFTLKVKIVCYSTKYFLKSKKCCINPLRRKNALPIRIGEEVARPSTWFKGYTDKFFFDRGVLYTYMYGALAFPMAVRFVIKMRNLAEHSFSQALSLMLKGMKEGRVSKKAEEK